MMGRKTLSEVREELEAALAGGAALRSERGAVPESLRRFLGRASAPGAVVGPAEGGVGPPPERATPTDPPTRRGRRGQRETGT
jgi:hypothetical protein